MKMLIFLYINHVYTLAKIWQTIQILEAIHTHNKLQINWIKFERKKGKKNVLHFNQGRTTNSFHRFVLK